jgi:hypothetical protein
MGAAFRLKPVSVHAARRIHRVVKQFLGSSTILRLERKGAGAKSLGEGLSSEIVGFKWRLIRMISGSGYIAYHDNGSIS